MGKAISTAPSILTINSGSSSVRFAVYQAGDVLRRRISGKIDRIGLSGTNMVVDVPPGSSAGPRRFPTTDHRGAADVLLDWLAGQPAFASVTAAGHRVVHGMTRSGPERVTPKLLAALHSITPYAPEHLPREIALIEAIQRRHPTMRQVACFDTSFHRTMPRVAKLLALPRRYTRKGLERYGFHGLSFAYLMQELARLDPPATQGRVILAHLGNGASLAAVHKGDSIDTSMGFTPMAGLMMGTRAGDLDPGVTHYLARTERMTAAGFQRVVSQQSGLLGVSGISSDVRDLLARETTDPRASDAIALFCYQAKKWIGAYAAALGGLDTLVFAGGIGENAPIIRKRICEGLGFLGIEIDHQRNMRNAHLISPTSGRVKVRVIRTDEELMIARSASCLFNLGRGGIASS